MSFPSETGSFSKDNGDGNENVKKVIGLISKTTTLHVHQSSCFAHFFAVTARLRRVVVLLYGGGKQKTTNFLFSLLAWARSKRNQFQENHLHLRSFASRNNRKQGLINSDVFVAVEGRRC